MSFSGAVLRTFAGIPPKIETIRRHRLRPATHPRPCCARRSLFNLSLMEIERCGAFLSAEHLAAWIGLARTKRCVSWRAPRSRRP